MIKVYIRWMHKIAPKATDVDGPFEVDYHTLHALRTPEGARKFLKKALGTGVGRFSDFRVAEDGAILCFNPSEFTTMHGVYIEPPGACSVERFGPASDAIRSC